MADAAPNTPFRVIKTGATVRGALPDGSPDPNYFPELVNSYVKSRPAPPANITAGPEPPALAEVRTEEPPLPEVDVTFIFRDVGEFVVLYHGVVDLPEGMVLVRSLRSKGVRYTPPKNLTTVFQVRVGNGPARSVVASGIVFVWKDYEFTVLIRVAEEQEEAVNGDGKARGN